jgi:hypothetical protein
MHLCANASAVAEPGKSHQANRSFLTLLGGTPTAVIDAGRLAAFYYTAILSKKV